MSLRLIIVGKTGNGKSSTCNTLVGAQRFKSGACAKAVTTVCQLAQNDAMGLTIVDTPGICDSEAPLKERALEIQKSVLEFCREPHAFLLIFKMGRFTNDDKMSIALLEIIFGEEVFEHSIVVLTHGCNSCARNDSTDSELSRGSAEYVDEQFENQNELESFWTGNETLKRLVERCNTRVLRIENDDRLQCSRHTTTKMFERLIIYVKLVSNNGTKAYKNEYINTNRQTLEKETEHYDNLQEEIKDLQETLNTNLQRDRAEIRERRMMDKMRERERKKREMIKKIKREDIAVVGIITAVSTTFTGFAGAATIGGMFGAACGGPDGLILGLGIGAAVTFVNKSLQCKQKQD